MNKPHGIFFQPPIETNYFGHIFEEVYKTRLFDSVVPKDKKDTLAIDVGANVGIVSYYLSSRFDKVYAIEPSTRHWEVLNHMLEYNEIKNVFPFQFALSPFDGEANFYNYINRTMDSLYALQGMPADGMETAKLKRLDVFFEEQKIEKVDLLKLDCEGLEFDILCSESFYNVADKIKVIVCEIHGHSGRDAKEIEDTLRKFNFNLYKVPHDAYLIIGSKEKLN